MNSVASQPLPVDEPLESPGRLAAARSFMRLASIDRLRGLVIIIMALDHVRDFVNRDSAMVEPTDLAHTFPALFLTRIITHFCAPTFVLLAGISAYLYGRRLTRHYDLAQFLVTRGVWLIIVDIVVISHVWTLQRSFFPVGTLWAIGVSLIVLAGISRFGTRGALIIGVIIIATHNLLDGIHAVDFGSSAPLWNFLHEQGNWQIGPISFFFFYPVLPWIGIMALGYGIGPLFTKNENHRNRVLLLAGSGMIIAFLILRSSNIYGDPVPWVTQPQPLMTALGWLNTNKYPPSLLYTLMTLGPMFLVLIALTRFGGWAGRFLETYGKVPFFVYVLHVWLARAITFVFHLSPSALQKLPGATGIDHNVVGGLSLGQTYLVWAALILLLYLPCRWFASVKARHSEQRWLSYL